VGEVKNPKFAKAREEFIDDLKSKGRTESTMIAYANDRAVIKLLLKRRY
jgi:hypothetical protein